MWTENEMYIEDMEYLNGITYIPWEKLKDTVMLITGATGLIGCNIVKGLLYVSQKKRLNIKIVALVRSLKRANEKFGRQIQDSGELTLIEGEVENLPYIDQPVDYIIHGASPTMSSYFIEYPVETITTSVIGTMNMLKLALDKKVRSFVYLSSMEVYGETRTEELLSEKDVGYMNPLIVRNSYSESKRMCENMVVSYASEYHVPAMSVRLAQTFGAGVEKNDTRVFAEFARCAIEERDIVLLTDGGSKRCYLYTMDAVSAILTVLLKGEAGKSYNAGNPDTYCSVKEMAHMVAEKIADSKIKVKYSEDLESSRKFSPPHFYNLGIDKISELGWNATKELQEMYYILIKNFGDSNGV